MQAIKIKPGSFKRIHLPRSQSFHLPNQLFFAAPFKSKPALLYSARGDRLNDAKFIRISLFWKMRSLVNSKTYYVFFSDAWFFKRQNWDRLREFHRLKHLWDSKRSTRGAGGAHEKMISKNSRPSFVHLNERSLAERRNARRFKNSYTTLKL